MLIDLRFYTVQPGAASHFLAMVEAEGLPIQRRHCGRMLFCAGVHTGMLNTIVQAWAYRDVRDRDERLARLQVDARWHAFGERALPLVRREENRLLRTTAFTTAAEPFTGTSIVDLRTYTFAPGTLNRFLALCESRGIETQRRHCGHLVFHAISETGILNQLVQAWAYRGLDDYQQRQHALLGDATWQHAYRAQALALAVEQSHVLLETTTFSPTVDTRIVPQDRLPGGEATPDG
ncbi:MAG: NIPSNAP family protein [Lautropia sp.]